MISVILCLVFVSLLLRLAMSHKRNLVDNWSRLLQSTFSCQYDESDSCEYDGGDCEVRSSCRLQAIGMQQWMFLPVAGVFY